MIKGKCDRRGQLDDSLMPLLGSGENVCFYCFWNHSWRKPLWEKCLIGGLAAIAAASIALLVYVIAVRLL